MRVNFTAAHFLLLLCGCTFLTVGLIPAAQAEVIKPSLSGTISIEFQDDWILNSDFNEAKKNTLYAKIEPNILMALTKKLAIEASLVMEPIQDSDSTEDTYFSNEGIFVEELKITYTDEDFSLHAGKFNPSFGTAWDITPGIYGVDFAEDYELTEQIGLGASIFSNNQYTGSHILTVNTFFADTSFLSQSKITDRDELDEKDGGLSNTNSLKSFSITLDTQNTASIEGLNTHIGIRNLAPGDDDENVKRETGFVFGASYNLKICDNISADINGEWVHLSNAEATEDKINYLTTGAGLAISENWNAAISYTARGIKISSKEDINDHLFQVSGGYEFDNGLSANIGYVHTQEDGVISQGIGVLFGYEYKF